MRIGFDTSALVRPHPPGIVRVVTAAMAALQLTPGITAVPLAPSARDNLRIWRQLRLPLMVRERGLVGLHSFVSAFPCLGPGVRVQTIHELPWLQGAAENAGLSHRFWARLASRRADRIVCSSARVAAQLGAPQRVRLCPWGVDAAHFGTSPAPERAQRARELAGLRNDSRPLLLAIGAVRAKKNLAALLRGLHERRRRGEDGLCLLVSGEVGSAAREDQRLAQQLGLENDVRWIGSIDDELLIALLHQASLVSVLSRSEGFALPVLEAFAAGKCVLVPRDSIQAETAAGLGVEVDADDPASVADGLRLALDDSARDATRREHAGEYSWARCAARIAEIWREFA
jgi:glycosyltransferase involved in cell wall biosynthesis